MGAAARIGIFGRALYCDYTENIRVIEHKLCKSSDTLLGICCNKNTLIVPCILLPGLLALIRACPAVIQLQPGQEPPKIGQPKPQHGNILFKQCLNMSQ